MLELSSSQFGSVLPLYRSAGVCFPLIHAVICGHQRGQVFVNEITKPTVAIVANSFGFVLYLGDEDAAESSQWLASALDRGGMFNASYLLWYAPPPTLASKLGQQPKLVRCRERIRLIFDPQSKIELNDHHPPSGYEIVELNEDVLPMAHHLGLNITSRFWNSSSDFLRNGFGVCVLKDGLAASVCYSACVVDGLVEIDVATDPQHRRLGLASVVLDKFIRCCQYRNLLPTWDCFRSNTASLRLAERSGFCKQALYSFYTFNVPLLTQRT